MKKKTKTEIIICAAVLLGIAFVYDLTQGDGYLGNRIAKREVGEGSSQLEFVIKGEGLEIIKLDTYQGNVAIKGKINSLI